MRSGVVLLAYCALVATAAGSGEPCEVDTAGTRGDCRPIGQCPELLRIAQAAQIVDQAVQTAGQAVQTAGQAVHTAGLNSAVVMLLKRLTGKCPWSAERIFQVCCQNEATRSPPPPRVEVPTECGQGLVGSRVIGGQDAEIGELPWMVSLQYSTEPGGPLTHRCGGTLITSRHVLTAAHCVTYPATPRTLNLSSVSVTLGELDFGSDPDCLPDDDDEDYARPVCADRTVTVNISDIFPHPDFQHNTDVALPSDIAVLRLSQEVAFTDFIKPICLLTDLTVLQRSQGRCSPNCSDLTSGLKGRVAGWGRSQMDSEDGVTAVLQIGSLPIQNISDCEALFVKGHNLSGRICAGGGANGTDTCRGDSGGPLMVANRHGTKWYQVGISSFGSMTCGSLGGYTRVLHYKQWIEEQINKP